MTELAGVFRRPFAQQVAAFRLRLNALVPSSKWDDLWQDQHDRAFMVAGALKADLLSDLAGAMDKAISQGTTLEEFRRDFRQIVKTRGWHGWTGEGTEGGEAWRTRVIYQTNMRVSYAAGRYAQLQEGNFAFWIYFHGGSQEPRLDHLGWNGIALPPGHLFWIAHYPPNGWGCSCYVIGARSLDAVRRRGGDPNKALPDDWQSIDARTGAPDGIGKGWAYAPGASVADTVSVAGGLLQRMPAQMGAQFAESLSDQIDRAWPLWLADTQARGRHKPGLVGHLSQDVIALLGQLGISPASAEIMVQPGLVTGPKARRHEQKGDALSAEDWLHLPALMRKPLAILRDERTGRLLYILGGNDRVPQMAVDFGYRFAKGPEANTVVSAYKPTRDALNARLKGGLLNLLWGKL